MRTNRLPNEPLHPSPALEIAVDDIFADVIEDRQ